jgi:hypothetical protein
MDKLYRMVYADGFCFKSFGVTCGVRTSQPSSINRIKAQLPPGPRVIQARKIDRLYSFLIQGNPSRTGIHLKHFLYANSQRLSRAGSETELMDMFVADLNVYIARNSPNRLFVHAGVIGWKGKAIVIPGRSFSGKTTLVKEFLRQGATYYSDEFAVIDSRGHVYPFLKPLGIRDSSQKQTKITAEQLGCPVGTKPLQIEFVLLTHYDRTARWRPRSISRGQAVLKLLQNSFSVREKPEVALAFAEAAVRNATIIASVRGEAEEAVRSFLLGGSRRLNQDFATQVIQPQREGYERKPEDQAEAI